VVEEGDANIVVEGASTAGIDTFALAPASVHGIDAVWAFTSYTLADNVEILVLGGNADIDGTGNVLDNIIIGNGGNNVIDGKGGGDAMLGLGGNDTYFVDDVFDHVVEAAGQGTDTINSSISLGLADNVENLNLTGTGNLNARGNGQANAIVGNDGANAIDGGAGADTLTGGLGNDTFIFGPGQANGDTVVDFAGNGPGAGDVLLFSGYGAGADFTYIDATHWQVNYNVYTQHDVITFSNGAGIHVNDVLFV
jgi:Ca2+-binding RTX toxin-like protein